MYMQSFSTSSVHLPFAHLKRLSSKMTETSPLALHQSLPLNRFSAISPGPITPGLIQLHREQMELEKVLQERQRMKHVFIPQAYQSPLIRKNLMTGLVNTFHTSAILFGNFTLLPRS